MLLSKVFCEKNHNVIYYEQVRIFNEIGHNTFCITGLYVRKSPDLDSANATIDFGKELAAENVINWNRGAGGQNAFK